MVKLGVTSVKVTQKLPSSLRAGYGSTQHSNQIYIDKCRGPGAHSAR